MPPKRNRSTPKRVSLTASIRATGKVAVKDHQCLVDPNVKFDDIGGLDDIISRLKEILIIPLNYPDLFANNKVTPPRGIIFHGDPGTGKTLVAKAIANECKNVLDCNKPMSFFTINSAECKSMWLGESEKNIVKLFEEARKAKPAIIFIDELDALVPIRSYHQDQVYSSIVSTFLTILDGIEDQGEIFVIGATNRLDAIDPAIRRPGRFGLEVYFPLPELDARKHILQIHTKEWRTSLSSDIINAIAHRTQGYSGAELRNLCSEAFFLSLRKQYPEIYTSNERIIIDASEIEVKPEYFYEVLEANLPTESDTLLFRGIDAPANILLTSNLNSAVESLKNIFPSGYYNASAAQHSDHFGIEKVQLYKPRILLTGTPKQGVNSYLAPALLHSLKHLPYFICDPNLEVMLEDKISTIKSAFASARRKMPSIIFCPSMDEWWSSSSLMVMKNFFEAELRSVFSTDPILILGTTKDCYAKIPKDLLTIFQIHDEGIFKMKNPSSEEKNAFWNDLLDFLSPSEPLPRSITSLMSRTSNMELEEILKIKNKVQQQYLELMSQ